MPTKRLHYRRRPRGTLIGLALLTGLGKAKQIASAMNDREIKSFPETVRGRWFLGSIA